MPSKPTGAGHKHGSSTKNVTHTANQQDPSDPTTEEMSIEQIQEILRQAHQTVKPIVKREALNELVDEDILGFKML